MRWLTKDREFYRTFFSMLAYIALQNLIVYGVNLADNVMIGAYSEDALSGVALVNQIQFLLQMIVNGVGEGRFNPDGTITKQEAAVMVARAAKLCGMDTELDPAAVRDVLAQFTDYVTTPEWAREGLAFCYQEGILDDSAMEIQGKTEILRCEIAQMLYNLLSSAKLL